ncbi:MAG: hypothetical protein IPK83_25085 [Planctomycetes bacterium]|nr:hypothetical protein [Planctomycetota bacterium]
MSYDYMGRRVRKVIREWVMLVPPPTSPYVGGTWGWATEEVVDDFRYIYDGWNLVIEHRLRDRHSAEDFDEVTTRKFAWGCDLAGLNGGAATGNVQSAVHGAGGIGGLLAMEDTANEDPYADDPKYLYFYDGNGNVMQLVVFDDGGAVANTPPPLAALMYDGFVFASYEYDPYGGTLLAADWLGVDNPFRFSTKFYDAQPSTAAAGERGLYYYGYRYYSPRLGRWVNRDPIEERGGNQTCQDEYVTIMTPHCFPARTVSSPSARPNPREATFARKCSMITWAAACGRSFAESRDSHPNATHMALLFTGPIEAM